MEKELKELLRDEVDWMREKHSRSLKGQVEWTERDCGYSEAISLIWGYVNPDNLK